MYNKLNEPSPVQNRKVLYMFVPHVIPSHSVYDLNYTALENLFKISLIYQEQGILEETKYTSPKAYIKEVCTIKFNTSRQSGHSTSIVKLIEKYKQNMGKIIFVNLNKDVENRFKEKFIKNSEYNFDNLEFFTFKTLENMRGLYINTIIIDMTSLMSQEKKEELYNNLAAQLTQRPKEKFFIIFVE